MPPCLGLRDEVLSARKGEFFFMTRLHFSFGIVLFLLACVPGGKPLTPDGSPGAGVSTEALTTDTITAESLGSATALSATGADQSAASTTELAPTPPEPRPKGLAEIAPTAPDPAAEPVVADKPKPLLSREASACLRQGGLWIHAGKSIAMACVKPTKDAGKQCHREQDCQGVCLARSMTCAPYDPLFGCNEILQKDGSRVTLCLD